MISENFYNIKLEPILDSIKFEQMSDERYFSSEFKEYISNSKLSLINPEQDGSVEKYLSGLNNTYNDSFVLGSAVHELVLQPNEFELIPDVIRPTAKMGAMADELYVKFKENTTVTVDDIINASNKIGYFKNKMTENRIQEVYIQCSVYWQNRYLYEQNTLDKNPIYLDYRNQEKLIGCINSIKNNTSIQKLLYPEGLFETPISENEAAMFIDIKATYNNKETILKIKGKLDNYTIDLENNKVVLNDLKTTGHYVEQFGESFQKYHYYRQMALYLWMLKLYTKKQYNIDINSLQSNMLLVSTIPTFKSGVFRVTRNDIDKGFRELSNLLKRVAALELC